MNIAQLNNFIALAMSSMRLLLFQCVFYRISEWRNRTQNGMEHLNKCVWRMRNVSVCEFRAFKSQLDPLKECVNGKCVDCGAMNETRDCHSSTDVAKWLASEKRNSFYSRRRWDKSKSYSIWFCYHALDDITSWHRHRKKNNVKLKISWLALEPQTNEEQSQEQLRNIKIQ